MKIYIIGMPGSGKTYLGRQLAQSLKLQFIDLDEWIEKKEKRLIRTIIQEKGEPYFRTVEREVLHMTADKNNFIISCGGGTPVFFDNMEWMKNEGIVIWLNTPLEIISERISKNITRRPLFMGLSKDEISEKLNEIYKIRFPFYKKANFFIEGNGQKMFSLNTIIQQVIKYSKNKFQ
ncbi:MAG: shikimate kinase [Bacteroidota bacterium]